MSYINNLGNSWDVLNVQSFLIREASEFRILYRSARFLSTMTSADFFTSPLLSLERLSLKKKGTDVKISHGKAISLSFHVPATFTHLGSE